MWGLQSCNPRIIKIHWHSYLFWHVIWQVNCLQMYQPLTYRKISVYVYGIDIFQTPSRDNNVLITELSQEQMIIFRDMPMPQHFNQQQQSFEIWASWSSRLTVLWWTLCKTWYCLSHNDCCKHPYYITRSVFLWAAQMVVSKFDTLPVSVNLFSQPALSSWMAMTAAMPLSVCKYKYDVHATIWQTGSLITSHLQWPRIWWLLMDFRSENYIKIIIFHGLE